MVEQRRGSIIIAIEHGMLNVPEILRRLDLSARAGFERLLCTASSSDALALRAYESSNTRVLLAPPGSRIPLLWRDGIVAAQSDKVGLLSAHCIPSQRWLDAFDQTNVDAQQPGIGGFFSNADDSDSVGWAIYLQRYVNFSHPVTAASVEHIAADNAIYCRSAILSCRDLVPLGFWEPEYHRRFRAAGNRLRLTGALEVMHYNRYSAPQFMQQRFEHGIEFGLARAERMATLRTSLLLAASPLIPLVLCAKVLNNTFRQRWLARVPWRAFAWLMLFSLAWGAGEARGLAMALSRGQKK